MVASQTRYYLIATMRAGTSIAVGIVMPVLFFIGAALLFGSEALGGNTPVEVRGAGEVPDLRTFYVGGFMAYAIIYTAFVVLLPDMVDYRERGLLKRLRGTPPAPLGVRCCSHSHCSSDELRGDRTARTPCRGSVRNFDAARGLDWNRGLRHRRMLDICQPHVRCDCGRPQPVRSAGVFQCHRNRPIDDLRGVLHSSSAT